ncbi:hypothetical protein Vi05172_g5658 [Venturia inaequalis]|uniref:Nucleotide-diphospho-sugar transferase domain-containing protein n=1 Tax=Venturia inaequalis TaxID=5025 RepID=A0A8H3UE63_VENIN|nr:hypothetical protein EG327_011074 [Venturia inaequalis]RDI84234.1 hypothetical protein Vi05172_g5658 [Venturia inaequalis]
MIVPGREVRPAYLALSLGAFVTFIFITLVSFRDSNHPRNIREKFHQYNIPLISPSTEQKPSTPLSFSAPTPSRTSPSEISFEDAIRAIYAPMLHPIDAPEFIDPTDGEVYITNQTIYTEGFGKNLCIIDVDTRPLNGTDELMSEDFNWQSISGVSTGMLNHYLYAKIHGYDYKFIHTTEWHNKSREDVWTKIPTLRETLKDYRIVVMIDADAIFRNLNLPYEWLLNRWNFTEETSFTMPLDPVWDVNTGGRIGYTNNKYGVVNPNAGFITAQNLPRTFDMLDDWVSCPDNEEEFEGCDDFRSGWPAEQGVFGEYIRYKYNETTDFRSFDCSDGNGFPEQGSECRGIFVRHFTTGKGHLKPNTGDALLQTMMLRTHSEIFQNYGDVVVERNSTEIVEEAYWERVTPQRILEEDAKKAREEQERKDKETAKEKAIEDARIAEEEMKKAVEEAARKAVEDLKKKNEEEEAKRLNVPSINILGTPPVMDENGEFPNHH